MILKRHLPGPERDEPGGHRTVSALTPTSNSSAEAVFQPVGPLSNLKEGLVRNSKVSERLNAGSFARCTRLYGLPIQYFNRQGSAGRARVRAPTVAGGTRHPFHRGRPPPSPRT